jgi:hypothetical protein
MLITPARNYWGVCHGQAVNAILISISARVNNPKKGKKMIPQRQIETSVVLGVEVG